MIRFRLSPDVLGTVRLALSPLVEVGASLRLLTSPRPAAVHRGWLRRVSAELDRIDLDLLLATVPAGGAPLAVLFPSALGRATTIEQQVITLAATPAEPILDDLVRIWSGRARPRSVQRLIEAGPAAPRLLADAITGYWAIAIAPYWDRMRAVLEDDLAYRSDRSASGGLFSLLEDLHPEVSLDGAMLKIDKPHYPDATYEGNHMTLVPSIFLWPTLVLDHEADAFELTYPARGVGRVWEELADQPAADDPLGALIGASRSAILHQLVIPLSTTQLARRLEQSPATVSRHLAILRDSGMVVSWRSGRSMLYRRTALAGSLIGGPRRPVVEPAGPATPLHVVGDENRTAET